MNSRECHNSSKHQQPLTERQKSRARRRNPQQYTWWGLPFTVRRTVGCQMYHGTSFLVSLCLHAHVRMVPKIPSSLCLLLIQLSPFQLIAADPSFSRHHQYISPVCTFHCSTVNPLHAAITSILTSRHPNVSILLLVLSTSSSNVTLEILLCRYLFRYFLPFKMSANPAW